MRGVSGFKEARVVRRGANFETTVGAVEDANRVHENGVRIFETVDARLQKRRELLARRRVRH